MHENTLLYQTKQHRTGHAQSLVKTHAICARPTHSWSFRAVAALQQSTWDSSHLEDTLDHARERLHALLLAAIDQVVQVHILGHDLARLARVARGPDLPRSTAASHIVERPFPIICVPAPVHE